MNIRTTAPGKLILLGEYAVLEGAPALVIAVDRFSEIMLRTISSDHCIVTAPAIGISELPFIFDAGGKVVFNKPVGEGMLKKLSFFLATIEIAQSYANVDFRRLPSFEISMDTSQFFSREIQKLGLGSSAALTTAFFSALCEFGNTDFDTNKQKEFIFKAALQIHRKAQNNMGSGIDAAASVFGGALKYQVVDGEFNPMPVYEKLTIPDDLHILSVWAGESASTIQFIRKVNEFKLNKSGSFKKIIGRMRHSSITGIEAIRQNNVDQFMQAIQEYFEAMNELGKQSELPIVSKTHHQIHELVCAQSGAYKPSGAGGGDIGIAFCNSADKKANIAEKLSNSGFQIVNLQLTENGVYATTL